jgi:hypothetical protein
MRTKKTVYFFAGLAVILAVTKLWLVMLRDFDPILEKDFRSAENPIVSPSGEKILFVYNGNSGNGLYVVDRKGDNLKPVIENVKGQINYTWASDENRAAFSLGGKVFVYDFGKNSYWEIMSGWSPVWSPNGTALVFFTSDKKEIIIEKQVPINEEMGSMTEYVENYIGYTSLMLYDVKSGAVAKVLELPNDQGKVMQMCFINETAVRIVQEQLLPDDPSSKKYVFTENGKRVIPVEGWNVIDADIYSGAITTLCYIPNDGEKMKFSGMSPDGGKAVFLENDRVSCIDFTNNEMCKVADFKLYRISWSGDGQSLLYDYNNQIWLHNLLKKENIKIGSLSKKIFSTVSENNGVMALAAHLPTGDPIEDGERERAVVFVKKIKNNR